MGEHRAPDLGVAQRGVGYLVAHADGEGDVGEVAVAGMLLAVFGAERDAAVINTVYTLRYADQHFRSRPGGIAFGAEDGQQHPGYRDFAYVAFTIGVVIVAGSVNLISGLFR